MTFIVLAACSVATAQIIDPDPTNNEATASILAELLLLPGSGNLTIGGNASVLSPHQDPVQSQAQSQSQTSTIVNNNRLSNINANGAASNSSSTNNQVIRNINTFNPVIISTNSNSVGSITVRSANVNI
ncbi:MULTISPECIES: hypothetical protein [Methanobacterium]|uniref:Uncharacterized protein n=1 Tax=Methanobacterium bryantii TaxID=2161 RepID=A0A2A2H8Q6_METBR|nr:MULTISPECIES: hypothetical protein [Methanobacterium]OEC87828.1 hypothetical protein A9507_06545 [Methanobacterium sp. A39]PAV05696.1 hypothetical protein ASJ80_08155 [Methanobacterium bryantii]